jgi:hypothetical protein
VTQHINVPDGENSDGENSPEGPMSPGMTGSPGMPGAAQRDAFARLFAKHDRWLFSYLVTLLANSAHAEDTINAIHDVPHALWARTEAGF